MKHRFAEEGFDYNPPPEVVPNTMRALRVTGVPGFLLDRRLLVLGAQPREVFERAFSQLSEAPPDQ